MPELPERVTSEEKNDIVDHFQELNWYALVVKPRHERSCAASLSSKGYEELVPLYRERRRWSDRSKEVELPLFPGYVFCRFDARNRLPVLTTPGVLSVVSFGKNLLPVTDSEMIALRQLVRSGLPAQPWPYLEVGRRVRIQDGPLFGLEGLLLEIKQHQRLILSVSLLRRSVAVEVDAGCVRPLRPERMTA